MDQLKNKKRGFSTIELMIALAIIALVLSSVVMVSFSNQNFLVDSQTNSEAIKIAQGLLEEKQALARKDFNLVNPQNSIIENIYEKKVTVELLSDFLTKKVKAIVSWQNERGMVKKVELTTLISNFDSPVGGDTCNSVLLGDWTNPLIKNEGNTNFADLLSASDETYTLSDIDAYKNRLYITANKATDSAGSKDLSTLFIFDITDPENPDLLGQLDNAPNTIFGLNNIRVSEDPASSPQKVYAYATNAYSCDPISPSCDGQFYIFNITDPENIFINSKIKILSSPAVSGDVSGNSIFYKNSYLFLGLTKNAGPEFHILDVHNPETINSGFYGSLGSFEIDHAINAIKTKDNYVYLASASQSDKKLEILNISNPSYITSVNHFDLGVERGKSLFLIGDRLYFGKVKSTFDEENFYIFNNEKPEELLENKIIGSFDNLSFSVNDILTRSDRGFFLTNTSLEIFDTGEPTNINLITILDPLATIDLPASGSDTEPSMDCEGNYLYIVSNNDSGEGHLSVITSDD